MQAQAFFHDRTQEYPKTEAGYLFFVATQSHKKTLADNVLINGASSRQAVETDAHPLISMWSIKGFGSELRTFVRQPKCPAPL